MSRKRRRNRRPEHMNGAATAAPIVHAEPQTQPGQEITVRYAAVEDAPRIFQFLVLVSGPARLAEIEQSDAWAEVLRVLTSKKEFALIAEIDGELVGTLGIVAPCWWYNTKQEFLTDRWFFVYPALANQGVGTALLAEASLIAHEVGLKLIVNGKPRAKNKSVAGGVYFASHTIVSAEDDMGVPMGGVH